MDIYLLLGLLGMTLILAAFFLSQSHRLSADSLAYDLINLLGALFLTTYGVAGRAWPFVILNGVWALVSLKDVVGDMTATSKHG